MVVSNKFIFLHLQKCGGSFIRDFMLEHIPNSKKIVPQHNGYTTIEGNKGKPIIGIIRNPWDWYVSLYHYHLPAKNSFMAPIIKEGGSFEGWLKLFLNKSSGNIHDLNFGWTKNKDAGPYTYRAVKCFNNKGLSIKSLDEVNFNKVSIIKMEDLVPNFINILEEKNIKLNDKQLEALNAKKRVNTSKRNDYREYYTEETKALVAEKDRLIIDLFNYEF